MKNENDFLPPHTEEERENLKADIEANGLQVGVVVDEHGEIIDGRLRAELCDELKIDWKVGADIKAGLSDAKKKALRIRLNILRRATPPTQEQQQEFQRILLLAHPELSDGAIAKMCGSTQSTIWRRRQALIQSNRLDRPKESLGLDDVKRRLPKKQTRTIVKSKHDFDVTSKAIKELGDDVPAGYQLPSNIRREARVKKARERAFAATPRPMPDNIDLRHCDLRDLEIEPHSVDLILTDVMWDKGSEDDWRALAEKSALWLKEDGVFASIIGQRYLHKMTTVMSEHLHYQWIDVVLFEGRKTRERNGMLAGYRPVVILSPRKFYKFKGVEDVIKAGPPEKEYSPLQQSVQGTRTLLERLSKPGDLVVDPCVGTGTGALAVLTATDGPRRFIGCDRDEEMFKIARHRVNEFSSEEGDDESRAVLSPLPPPIAVGTGDVAVA